MTVMLGVLDGPGAPALGFGERPASSKPGTGAPVPGPDALPPDLHFMVHLASM